MHQPMEIKRVLENKAEYRELLLIADPEWESVLRYLDGDMSVAFIEGVPAAAIIVCIQNGMPEIMNIATYPQFRRRGLARKLIAYAKEQYAPKYDTMSVGTCTISYDAIAFYKSCGFAPTHIIKNFFIDNYNAPIYEDNGMQCVDMLYLTTSLET